MSQFLHRDGIKEFMIELILAHIEHKHKVLLSRAYKLLGKRKKLGQLQPQRVRVQKKAVDEVSIPPCLAQILTVIMGEDSATGAHRTTRIT